MPGIVGILSKICNRNTLSLLDAMIRKMMHERFYLCGAYSVPEMGLHAGWVAQEASFAAGQVFLNEQKDIALLFSGECFVDPETKSQLRQNGHSFVESGGDCLVHLYEEQREAFFESLNGLFSGLLIDRRQRKVFLFNDRYGMERIYWYETEDGFYFASEAKALLCVLPELRRFDREGVAQFLAFGCTLEERTLFQGVHLLPGGSLWAFDNGSCRKARYFSPVTWESQPTLSVEAFESEFQNTFGRILSRYAESEVKLGISLTAGLDTRMIMACLPQTARNPVCYTYSGQTADTLDARLASRVAAACGLEHKMLRIGPDFFADFPAWADRTIHATDGCFGISGAHEVYMNAQARRLAPLRLTGVFGGEILRGVSTFKPIALSPELLNPEMLPLVSATVERLRGRNERPVTFAAFLEIPYSIFGSVAACRSQISFRTPFLDNELVALAYRAPLCLRRSCDSAIRFIMQNNQALGQIPTDMGYLGKTSGLPAVLRRIVARLTFKLDYVNNEGLPHALSPLDPVLRRLATGARVLGHHKYLHYRSWFRNELAAYVNEILASVQTRQNPFWNANVLKRLASDHLSGRKNYVQEINAVLTIEAVERLLFQNILCGSEPLSGVPVQSALHVPISQS